MSIRVPIGRPLRQAAFALGLFFSISGAAPGQDAATGKGLDADGVVRDMAYFYQNRDQFETPRPIEIQFTVMYYDAPWRVMWARVDTSGLFIRVSDQPMNLKPGLRYRLRGTISNQQGLYAKPEDIAVVDETGFPDPVPASDRLHEWSALNNQWVAVEAYVDRQEVLDPDHVRLSALVRGRRINIRVLTHGRPLPNCVGAFVVATGVYSYSAAVLSAPANIDVWSPFSSSIQIRDTITNDPRFEAAATPVESLRSDRTGGFLRVVGAVHRQDLGRSITLRDATGQVTIISDQANVVQPGSLVEATGKVKVNGAQLLLTDGLYRALPADNVPQFSLDPGKGPTLRYTEQIAALTADDIKGRPAVALTGLVTWSRAIEPYLYLQDATGGVRVNLPPGDKTPISFGALLRVQGRVRQGAWLPEVDATEINRGADSNLGEPRRLTLDQAIAGVAESQWAELTGFVREVNHETPWTYLSLTTPSGEFRARLPEFPAAAHWINSVVHVRGVCTSTLNARGEPSGILLLMQSPELVQLEAALPTDLKSLPVQSLGRMSARGTRVELNRWVRTQGIVTYYEHGNFLYLQDGDHSIRVLCRETSGPSLGDRVDLVGLLGRESGKQVLREARILSHQPAPDEKLFYVAATITPDRSLDGLLARLSGTLVNVVESPTEKHLVLEIEKQLIEVVWNQAPGVELPRRCQPGATIEVTGVYQVELNDYREPRLFRLLVRDASDIKVKRPAPWLTLSRALIIASGLLLVSVSVIAWVALLRRTLNKQTKELIQRKDKEAKLEAELERSSRLESLGQLAGGLAHDFNNMLTVVVGNLTLAVLETPSDSKASEFLTEAEKAALRARELTQQLLTFARGGDPVRSAHRLPALIEESVAFALSGSPVSADFDLAQGLPPALIDRGQFSQAINNLVLYASRSMEKGGRIHFMLRETQVFEKEIPNLKPGTYLRLSLSYSGPAIPAEQLGKVFDPYFTPTSAGQGLGLATARSIIRRHQGHIEVSAKGGQGTTFTLWVPTTPELPASETNPPLETKASASLKVLFMDDDESIRKFAQNVLRRLGHTATVVADGTAAVHAYAAAWEANKPFDVVVLDLTVVGGMGGKEAVEHLMNIDPGVRAVVSSGYSSDPIMADYRSHGFIGIVSKPYKVEDLERNLLEVMQRQPPGQAKG